MRRRTIIMMVSAVLCGVGLGLLASFGDGFYTAICLFLYPYLCALMFLFISIDIANPPQVTAPRPRDARARNVTSERKTADGAMQHRQPARI